MFLTLNELSIKHMGLYNCSQARKFITDFVIFIQKLAKHNIIDEIIMPSDFFSIHITGNYGVTQWLSDKSVDNKYKQYFKRLLDKYQRYFDKNEIEGEFIIQIANLDCQAIGCAFALERDNIVISLNTHKLWKNKTISGKYTILNDEEELDTTIRSVENLSNGVSFDEVIRSHRKNMLEGITSGQDLWEKREKLYPNLIFCENVKDNLYQDSEKYHIMNVMTRLNRLQQYFSTYDGRYEPKKLGMNARTELDTVKKEPSLKNLRLFRKPDGSEEFFFNHIGFSGKYSGGRIYFLPDDANKKCFIGYIGRHLPTKKF